MITKWWFTGRRTSEFSSFSFQEFFGMSIIYSWIQSIYQIRFWNQYKLKHIPIYFLYKNILPWSWGLVRGSWSWGRLCKVLSMFSSDISWRGRYASPRNIPCPMIPLSLTHTWRYAPSSLLWASCTKLNFVNINLVWNLNKEISHF